MIDEKKVSEAGRPLPQVPGSGEEERLQAIDKAAMGGLAAPNEEPQDDAGDEPAIQKPAGQGSAAVKQEVGQALGLTPTMSEKMEQHLGTATAGGTDAGETSAQPRQQQDEAAKEGAASSGGMLELAGCWRRSSSRRGWARERAEAPDAEATAQHLEALIILVRPALAA